MSNHTTILRGFALCLILSIASKLLEHAEAAIFGRAWIEALVLAILLGAVVRLFWSPDARWKPGIDFCAKTVLELAIVLLGAGMSFQMIAAAGPLLFAGIVIIVALAIPFSYGISRAFGLPHGVSLLVACGNSICGNSAIAAVAPVIGAKSDDVALSIAFTAALGVIVVLLLPALVPLLHLTETQYGIVAGLTVYAVPQVLAATASVSAVATQMGTLVKLMRVLMLGPVVFILALLARHDDGVKRRQNEPKLRKILRFVPWFIIGFIAMSGLRSLGLIPEAGIAPLATITSLLTILAMAALGLGVDMRMLAQSGLRVTGAAALSIAALALMSLALLHCL